MHDNFDYHWDVRDVSDLPALIVIYQPPGSGLTDCDRLFFV